MTTDDAQKQLTQALLALTTEVRGSLVELTGEVRTCNERLARIEASQSAQNENVRTFWSTHWPTLVARIETLEGSHSEVRNDVADLRVRVAKVSERTPRTPAKTGAMVVGGGVGVAGIIEAIRSIVEGWHK